MRLTPRALGWASALAAVATALARPGAAAAPARVATLARVVRRGPTGRQGYASLVHRAGEDHVVRTDLGVRAQRGRAGRRRGLLAFAQISDVHVIDAQSPLRVEWTDRFDDPSPAPTATGIFASAYRPQEMLSAQVSDAMVREINAIGRGPVTGRRLALAVQTGDNSDNSQLNEIRWNIDVLDGARVRPDSGDLTRYEGVCDDDPTTYDRAYWHPHPAPAGATDDAGLLSTLALTPGARVVTPDPDRRLLARADIVEEHFTTSGLPVGHGFTATNRREGTAHYTVVRDGVRFVVLDTVNPNGYADGSIDQTQMTWLRRVLRAQEGGVVMVFSHHTSSTMGNPFVGTGADAEPRVLGDAVLALLLRHWEVVAWVNGHTHRNEVRAHRRSAGGGLWEISTASHIDWPQQSRLLEVTDNRDGTLSIFATMVGHAGPVVGGRRHDTSTPTGLAGPARELTANDWQDCSDTGLGGRRDRNVELLVSKPRRLRRQQG